MANSNPEMHLEDKMGRRGGNGKSRRGNPYTQPKDFDHLIEPVEKAAVPAQRNGEFKVGVISLRPNERVELEGFGICDIIRQTEGGNIKVRRSNGQTTSISPQLFTKRFVRKL